MAATHKRTELQQKGATAAVYVVVVVCTWHYCNQKSRRRRDVVAARCSTLVSSANRLTMKNLGGTG